MLDAERRIGGIGASVRGSGAVGVVSVPGEIRVTGLRIDVSP